MAQRSDTRSDSERPPAANAGGATNGTAVSDGKTNGESRVEVPPAPPLPAVPWRSYKEQVAAIAQRIVDAQRPIRVLQALRWEPAVEEAFRKSRFRELP